MTKLWKLVVNDWGWDEPKTLYFYSRIDAEKAVENYSASDGVRYAGRFNDLKARVLTETATPDEEYAYGVMEGGICGSTLSLLSELGYDKSGNKCLELQAHNPVW